MTQGFLFTFNKTLTGDGGMNEANKTKFKWAALKDSKSTI